MGQRREAQSQRVITAPCIKSPGTEAAARSRERKRGREVWDKVGRMLF